MNRSSLLGAVLLLALWGFVTLTGIVEAIFLPPPQAVFRSLAAMMVSGEIPFDAATTLARTAAGFALGAAAGLCLGVLMGHYAAIFRLMEMPVDFFRSIPATAVFPLFIAVWGLGNASKIAITAWAAGMVVLVNTIYGMRNVSSLRLLVARTKRVPAATTFLLVSIPSAAPFIFAGMRLGISLALVVELVAEMFLGSQNGLGRRIFNATSIFDMSQAYATVFSVGVLGYLLNQLTLAFERRLIHWSGK